MSRLIKPSGKILKNFNRAYPFQISRWASNAPAASAQQCLANIPHAKVTTLDNGLRVATEESGAATATVGLWIDSGSRSENENNNGVANFLGHMAFQGTKNRSRTDLELEVANLGAHLNAYTTREQTAFYGKCFSQDVSKVVNILSDIVKNDKFDEADIDSSREVILKQKDDQMTNNMQEFILDHLHTCAFQGTSLGLPVLGTENSIKNIDRQKLQEFRKMFYQPSNMVLVGAGGVDHDSLVKIAEDNFKGVKSEYDDLMAGSFASRYTGSDVRIRDDEMPLCYASIAVEGVGWGHPDHISLLVAKTLLGSWDPSHAGCAHTANNLANYSYDLDFSRFYNSFHLCYKNTGLWGIYFISEPDFLDDMKFNVTMEWRRLCTDPTDFEIERAKNTLRRELCQNLGSTTSVCEDIGLQLLRYQKRIPMEEIDAKIRSVTADDVRKACYEHIYDNCPVVASMGAVDHLFDYLKIRTALYWWRV